MSEQSVRNLVGRTHKDPWATVLGRRPGGYQIPEVGKTLIDLLGEEIDIHIVMASINMAAMLTLSGASGQAIRKIESIQEMLEGQEGVERVRLLIRWIRALLLEGKGEYKTAGEMIDRVETRMERLDMKAELRVLLADKDKP